MTGIQAIEWLKEKTNMPIDYIINTELVSKLRYLEVVYNKEYWSIEDIKSYQSIIDEKTFNMIVEDYENGDYVC